MNNTILNLPQLLEPIARLRLVPVVVVDDPADAAPLGAALAAGGLPVAEVTLRTAAARQVIKEMAQNPALLVGAGTVLRPAQVGEALEAGARFIVTPGFSLSVVRECQVNDVPVLPGVATATELMMALDAGLSVVKFFPAGTSGGAAAIKALAAPFGDVRFVPTGGVGASNLHDYLSLPAVLAVGGSWMVARDLVADKNFVRITELTAAAVAQARPGN